MGILGLGFFVGTGLCYCVICCSKKKNAIKETFLKSLNGIVTRRHVTRNPRYFIGGRKFPSDKESGLICTSVFAIAACVSFFFLLLIVEITNECRDDPYLDCFRKKSNLESTDFFVYEQSPTGCSAISSADIVLCFRVDAPDAQRLSIAGGASYLMFQIITVCLLLVSYWMLPVLDNGSGHCKGCTSDNCLGRCQKCKPKDCDGHWSPCIKPRAGTGSQDVFCSCHCSSCTSHPDCKGRCSSCLLSNDSEIPCSGCNRKDPPAVVKNSTPADVQNSTPADVQNSTPADDQNSTPAVDQSSTTAVDQNSTPAGNQTPLRAGDQNHPPVGNQNCPPAGDSGEVCKGCQHKPPSHCSNCEDQKTCEESGCCDKITKKLRSCLCIKSCSCSCDNYCKSYYSLRCTVLLLLVLIVVWLIARKWWDGYDYQIENIQFVEMVQIFLAFFPVAIFTTCVPWNDLNIYPKYVEEVTKPWREIDRNDLKNR